MPSLVSQCSGQLVNRLWRIPDSGVWLVACNQLVLLTWHFVKAEVAAERLHFG